MWGIRLGQGAGIFETKAYSRASLRVRGVSASWAFQGVTPPASLLASQTFGNIYGRLSNPTTAVLEERIATLEGGRGGTCTSSGHAAQLLALFPLMNPGDRMVASNKL